MPKQGELSVFRLDVLMKMSTRIKYWFKELFTKDIYEQWDIIIDERNVSLAFFMKYKHRLSNTEVTRWLPTGVALSKPFRGYIDPLAFFENRTFSRETYDTQVIPWLDEFKYDISPFVEQTIL